MEAQEDDEDEGNYKDFDAIASLGGMAQKQTIKLDSITEDLLIQILTRDNKLASIVRDIKKIDKDNNGYVLINELNKIFKTYYQRELDGKTLNKVLRPFSSIQNKQLIDYKRFNLQLLQKLKLKELESYNTAPVAQDSMANLKEHIDVTFNPSSPASGQRVGAIAALIQESNSRNLNNQMRKSLTDMNQIISKTVNPELKKSFDPKMMMTTDKGSLSRILLDPIRPVENAPRTQESPKANRPQNRQSPSPPRENFSGPASVFGGKSSGFESYRS